jgi:hypothetical protein
MSATVLFLFSSCKKKIRIWKTPCSGSGEDAIKILERKYGKLNPKTRYENKEIQKDTAPVRGSRVKRGMTAIIILTGLVEAVWGLRQLYGFESSQHMFMGVGRRNF